MLEHRERVLASIRDRLASHGFDAEATYREWISALQRIVELSRGTSGDCVWSASIHPDDPCKSKADVERFTETLDRERERSDET